MIPFIIGGVALAATGYGLAKLLEDDCSNNRNINYGFDKNEEDENDKELEERTKPFHINLYDDEEAQIDEAIEKYELAKIELYNTSLMELRTALSEIENLDREIFIPTLPFEQKVYPFKELSDEIKQTFEKYTSILQKTKEYVDGKLDSLDSIIISQSDYEKYSDENKNLVNELMNLCTLLDKATQSRMTNDTVTISREINRGFLKIEATINI